MTAPCAAAFRKYPPEDETVVVDLPARQIPHGRRDIEAMGEIGVTIEDGTEALELVGGNIV
jgi:hypothetical protein